MSIKHQPSRVDIDWQKKVSGVNSRIRIGK